MSSYRARIGPSGRLVIPAAQRRELGLEVGDEVLLETAGDELRVSSVKHRIARVQALVRKHNATGETQTMRGLVEGYRAMAADEAREREAIEWVENLIGDVAAGLAER
jgi:AbrB family looped-hinge helix DNA binding protein